MRKLFWASSVLLFWSLFLSCNNTSKTPTENPESDKKPAAKAADQTGANDSLFYIIDEAFEKPIGQTTISFLKTITPNNNLYVENSLYSFEKGRKAKLCWVANDSDKNRKYAIIIFDSDGNRLFKHLSSFTSGDKIQTTDFTPPYSFDGLVSFWQLKKGSGRERYRSLGTESNAPPDLCPENAKGGFLINLLPQTTGTRKTISSTKSDGGSVVVTIDDR
jgi:hypothetical protein